MGSRWDELEKEGPVDPARILLPGSIDSPLLSDDPWHEIGATGEPAFANGWVNHGKPPSESAAFYKDPTGRVHLKGTVKNGTVNTTIFTLPAGYRPAAALRFAAYGVSSTTTTPPYVFVNAAGTVAQSGAGGVAIFQLDGVSFLAEG